MYYIKSYISYNIIFDIIFKCLTTYLLINNIYINSKLLENTLIQKDKKIILKDNFSQTESANTSDNYTQTEQENSEDYYSDNSQDSVTGIPSSSFLNLGSYLYKSSNM